MARAVGQGHPDGGVPEARSHAHGPDTVSDLNAQFLTLLCSGLLPAPRVSGAATLAARIADLGERERRRLAGCPVTLFHLPFARLLLAPPRGDGAAAGEWPGPRTDAARQAFALTASLAAWHLSRYDPAWCRLAFRVDASATRVLADASLSAVIRFAGLAADRIGLRFGPSSAFWETVLGAAEAEDGERLRRSLVASVHLATLAGGPVS
jgi:hypothetical protein